MCRRGAFLAVLALVTSIVALAFFPLLALGTASGSSSESRPPTVRSQDVPDVPSARAELITVCKFTPWAAPSSSSSQRRCDYEQVSDALAAACSDCVIVVEQGRYVETLVNSNRRLSVAQRKLDTSSSSSSSIRIKANNVTLEYAHQCH
jgi:hypothetical protein